MNATCSAQLDLSLTTPQRFKGGMLDFFHTIEKLKLEKRTGWVNHKVEKPESIADHMYRMGMMAMVLPETEGPPLNIAKCVMMSLVHDLAEADVGDITPPHASGVSREEKLALESKAMERILGLLGHPSLQSLRIKSLWDEYEARETPESKFVKDLDLFELAVQAVEYETSNGITTLQEFFESTVPRILHPSVQEWATELMDQRRASWEARGLGAQYVHIAPKGTTATSQEQDRTKRIPERVWGTHANGEEGQEEGAPVVVQ